MSMTVLPPRALWTGLFDDAAVFPPGNASLPQALTAHRALRTGPYADLVGPLLVPAGSVAELAALLAPGDALRIGIIARPGTPVEVLRDGLAAARAAGLEIAGIECGWSQAWRDFGLGDVPLTLEVGRGPEQGEQLADIRAGRDAGQPVQAKFRTGATPTWPWPNEDELATFIASAVGLEVPVKLTGGLHHVVRGEHQVDGSPDTQHGLLNVLAAFQQAIAGADHETLKSVLSQRDSATLASSIVRWPTDDNAAVRRIFTAYGCCGVLDPITELLDLNLLEEGIA